MKHLSKKSKIVLGKPCKKPATKNQLKILDSKGIKYEKDISMHQASRLISKGEREMYNRLLFCENLKKTRRAPVLCFNGQGRK